MMTSKIPLKDQYQSAALEAGGSFLPEVLGNNGNRFADCIVRECAQIAMDRGNLQTVDAILRHFGLPIHCNICDQEYHADCDYRQGRCPHHPALINLDNLPKSRFLNLYRFLTGKD